MAAPAPARAAARQAAETTELQREAAYQHQIVEQQRHVLAALGAREEVATDANGKRVAMESYGLGTI